MKNFIRNFIVLFLISSAPIKIYSQEIEIEIDSIFNSSFELFPFEQNENISGITVDGDVHLNSDTSLVRVILEDDNGIQYMILETYPLICPGQFRNYPGYCDETCFLEQVNPNSIIIQVIDATFNLKNYVIAYYDIDLKYNAGEITINDLKGNVLRIQIVSPGKNQVVFNLKNLPNGLYIFTLNANNQILQSKKISKGGY